MPSPIGAVRSVSWHGGPRSQPSRRPRSSSWRSLPISVRSPSSSIISSDRPPMHPRTYALTLVAAGLSLFVGVVGANLILDPQYVFNTGLFSPTVHWNSRYARLTAYREAPQQYNGLLFG